MLALKVLFWVSLFLIAWVYLGYALSLAVLAAFRDTRRRRTEHLPTVTLVISAYNEADIIREKLQNCLQLDYPREKLEVLVISDASDDGTDQIVEEYKHRGVVLLQQEPRGGKTRGLTRFVPEATGQVLVFSDANSIYRDSALRHLVHHFADPKIGYVVGHQRYEDEADSPAARSEGLYWNYELALKRWESAVGSVVGGDGAIYAIRSELFFPLRDDDISDFVNPIQIIRAGYRGVFEPEAICYEKTAATYRGEFRRKVRIVNRSLRGLLRVPEVMDPRRVGWFAYEIIVHKLLRWFAPYFLLFLFLSSLALHRGGAGMVYTLTMVAQAACYGLALCGAWAGIRTHRVFSVPFYFCVLNAAALLGTLGVLFGKRYTTWKPER